MDDRVRVELLETEMALIKEVDAVAKETRTYPVRPVYELLILIAVSLWGTGYFNLLPIIHISPVHIRDYWLPYPRQNYGPTVQVLRMLLSPFEQFSTFTSQRITPPTAKTSIHSFIHGSTLRTEIKHRMITHMEATGLVYSLDNLLENNPELKTEIEDLYHLDVQRPQSFLSEILSELYEGFIDESRGSKIMETLVLSLTTDRSGLTMKVKTILGRAQVRAYYSDRNIIRHLTGAVVQKILTPTMRDRDHLEHRREIYPSTDANVLRIQVVTTRRYVRILQGDISSFTNSFVSTWVLLLVVVLTVMTTENLRYLNNPACMNVDGIPFEFRPMEVLYTYIMMCVGATASTPRGGHRAPGGFLGVPGNNAAAMLGFSIIIMMISVLLGDELDVVFEQSQLGGDDYEMMISAHSIDLLNQAEHWISVYIEQFVGAAKEPISSTFDMRDPITEFPLPQRFCQKEVRISVWGEGIIDLFTCDAYPIPSSIFLALPEEKVVESYYSLLREVDQNVHNEGEAIRLKTILTYLYMRTQKIDYIPPYTHYFKVMRDKVVLNLPYGTLTIKAWTCVITAGIPPIQGIIRRYFTEEEEILTLLLARELLKVSRVTDERTGEVYTVFHETHEHFTSLIKCVVYPCMQTYPLAVLDELGGIVERIALL